MNASPDSDLSSRLAAELPAYLPRQRWYGDHGQRVAAVDLLDRCDLLALAGLRFVGGRRAAYLLPLRQGRFEPNPLEDAVWQTACLQATNAGERCRGERGEFLFALGLRHGAGLAGLAASGFRARLSRAEQSNSSLVFADPAGQDRWLLKLFRRVAAGVNPELEITEFLSDQAAATWRGPERSGPPLSAAQARPQPRPRVPTVQRRAVGWGPTGAASEIGAAPPPDFSSFPLLGGSIVYRPAAGGEDWTLAVWQQFVPNLGDGWAYFVERLGGTEASPQLLGELAELGERTAALHLALASGTEPAFVPEPITAEDQRRWLSDLAQWVGKLAPELKRALPALPPDGAATARRVLLRLAALPDLAPDLAALAGVAKIRVHGDYHLGQVLRRREGGWTIFDFEGEPARPLAERRRKHCALKDVAGMLRSLDYLAFAAGQARAAAELSPLPDDWRAAARQAFWSGYRVALAGVPPGGALLPADPAAGERALAFFEIEKAVYEIAYELQHRPDWLPIPLAGLARLLAAQ